MEKSDGNHRELGYPILDGTASSESNEPFKNPQPQSRPDVFFMGRAAMSEAKPARAEPVAFEVVEEQTASSGTPPTGERTLFDGLPASEDVTGQLRGVTRHPAEGTDSSGPQTPSDT